MFQVQAGVKSGKQGDEESGDIPERFVGFDESERRTSRQIEMNKYSMLLVVQFSRVMKGVELRISPRKWRPNEKNRIPMYVSMLVPKIGMKTTEH